MKKRDTLQAHFSIMSSWVISMGLVYFLIAGFSFSLAGQELSLFQQGDTRAIIIGISEYQNDEIEDLQFAHKDAEAFYDYITSPAGGAVDPVNIKLLTNELATNAKINEVMDWLMSNSEEGDKAIIYFSGHGDVETVSKRKQGFLLPHDSPSKVYRAGAYPIYYLQITLETLADANVETIVITDACRSGKLAGNEFGGTQATATALQQQFANEMKIMSCQPNEFSLEGKQWGGGRSVFSWYLIQGLIGVADRNEDGVVTLMEIGRYLEDRVTQSVLPEQQVPLVEGNRNSKVAIVDDATLEKLMEEIPQEIAIAENPNSKPGGQNDAGEQGDKLSEKARRLMEAFERAIDSSDFMDGENSACAVYEKIAETQELQGLKDDISRSLSTALQETVQKAINLYLESDASELNDRWNFSEKYAKYPRYLEKAAELLPDDHYSLNSLKCNQLYFEGMLLRLQWQKDKTDKSLLLKARALQLQALSYDEYAAHVYNELGLIYSGLGDTSKEIESYLKALELSPNWAMPNSNLGVAYMQAGQLEEAIPYMERAIKEKPGQPVFYLNIALIYEKRKSYAKALEYIEKATLIEPNNWKYLLRIGNYQFNLDRLIDAKNTFNKIDNICSNNPECLNDLATEYYLIKDYDQYLKLINRAITLSPDNNLYKNNLIYYYLEIGDNKGFELKCLELIDQNIARPKTCKELSAFYARKGNENKALIYLKQAFEKGLDDIDSIPNDESFKDLKNNPEFQALIEKYTQ